MYQIHRKIPVLESLFDRFSGFEACNFNHLLLSFVKKEVWNLSPELIFSLIFEDKYFSRSTNWPNFVAWFWKITQNLQQSTSEVFKNTSFVGYLQMVFELVGY